MKDVRTNPTPYDGTETTVFLSQEDGRHRIVVFYEGCGDNLLPEDIKEGYVDYVNWETYILHDEMDATYVPEIRDADGGMVMFKDFVRDLTLGTVAKAVLRDAEAKDGDTALLWEVAS